MNLRPLRDDDRRSAARRHRSRSSEPSSRALDEEERLFVSVNVVTQIDIDQPVELVPGEQLVMRTAEGPFPMETTYSWAPTTNGGTHMTLRNRGEPTGFSKLVAPFMTPAMRRANRKDFAALKALLEQTSS